LIVPKEKQMTKQFMGSDCLDFFAAGIGISSDSFSQAEWHDATAKREAAEKD
jgi:hypothetical protein